MNPEIEAERFATDAEKCRRMNVAFNAAFCSQPFDFEDSEKSKRAPVVRWRGGYPIMALTQSCLVHR